MPPENGLIRRDTNHEKQAMNLLWPLGFRRNTGSTSGPTLLSLPTKWVPQATSALIDQGWVVTKDQQLIRNPQRPVLSVSTGIDWFELRGTVSYHTENGDQQVPLPDILSAAKAGRATVILPDGSQGMLPEQWLTENGLLQAIGQLSQDHVRFKSTQAVILDSLLSRQATVDMDEKFKDIRNRLRQVDQIKPTTPAPTFQGMLRPYQQEGLGWLFHLQALAIGGILADDMGLGKTVQVLAMLDWHYNASPDESNTTSPPTQNLLDTKVHRPSLIVVPRSIVFNWINEASRFSPQLRVQPYTGSDRKPLRDAFGEQDVIVTSYGLMRRDIDELTKHPFHYVVLDEAQTIKNAGSQSAKAARLLDCHYRLALTGTPVENHMGDLWSIFEFLNQGMLGSNSRFAQLIRSVSQNRRGELSNGDDSAPAAERRHVGRSKD